MNSWRMPLPTLSEDVDYIPVKVIYFLDIALDDIFLRLVYHSTSGDDENALELLLGMLEYFDFYEEYVDLNLLQNNMLNK